VHPIIVVNEAPLSNILNNPSAIGRVSLWGIKLSPMDITYEKRKVIKSQILPYFTVEWLELQTGAEPGFGHRGGETENLKFSIACYV
jgi:hypothetical protein